MPTLAEQLQARKLFNAEMKTKRLSELHAMDKRQAVNAYWRTAPIEDGIKSLAYPELFDGKRYKELKAKICYSILKENHVGMKRKNVNYYRPDVEIPIDDLAHDVLVEVMEMTEEYRSRYQTLTHALSCVAWTHMRRFLRNYARCGRSLSDVENTLGDTATIESWERMKARITGELSGIDQ